MGNGVKGFCEVKIYNIDHVFFCNGLCRFVKLVEQLSYFSAKFFERFLKIGETFAIFQSVAEMLSLIHI